jgi:hypothetical protein
MRQVGTVAVLCNYIRRFAPLVVVTLCFDLAACRSAPLPGSATPIRLAVGDSLETVQAVLHVSEVPKKAATATGVPETQMILAQRGIWIFFDSANKALQYRFDAPFAGNIQGVRIGASMDETKAALGSPVRAIPVVAVGQAYLYQVNGVTIRCDFDSRGILQTIRVLGGVITFIEPQTSFPPPNPGMVSIPAQAEEFGIFFGSAASQYDLCVSRGFIPKGPRSAQEDANSFLAEMERRTEDHAGVANARKGWELAKQEIDEHRADFTEKRCEDVQAQWIKLWQRCCERMSGKAASLR